MKILGLDYGQKRLGLAIGNTQTRTVNPIPAILRKNDAAVIPMIKKVIQDYEIEKIVIGYPLNMDGSLSAMCARVDRFINFLKKRLKLKIAVVDERLSSREAGEPCKSLNGGRGKKKVMLDSLSAQVILKNYLEFL